MREQQEIIASLYRDQVNQARFMELLLPIMYAPQFMCSCFWGGWAGWWVCGLVGGLVGWWVGGLCSGDQVSMFRYKFYPYESEVLEMLSKNNMIIDIVHLSNRAGVFGTGEHIRIKFLYSPSTKYDGDTQLVISLKGICLYTYRLVWLKGTCLYLYRMVSLGGACLPYVS